MGREELDGVKLELGDRASKMIVAEARYLLTDPIVNSQIISLEGRAPIP